MPGMADYNRLRGFAELTGLVLMHFRWWKLSICSSASEGIGEADNLMAANYIVLLLALALVESANNKIYGAAESGLRKPRRIAIGYAELRNPKFHKSGDE
jgi:hypothetical protein